MDAGDVPERIQASWADGANVVARLDGVALHVAAYLDDEGMILEEVGP